MFAQKNLDVRRVRSSLVATFAKANPPLVWRYDLERNHSFTLALQGDDQEWELGVTAPNGEFNPVARFVAREDGEEALAAVGAALSKGCLGWLPKFFKILGIIILVGLVALLVLSQLAQRAQTRLEMPDTPLSEQGLGMPAPSSVPPSAPASTGAVPLPADDVLKPPTP